jgi:hypothetical protein
VAIELIGLGEEARRRQAHSEQPAPQAPPADEVEAKAVEWFRQRIYGTPRTEEESS